MILILVQLPIKLLISKKIRMKYTFRGYFLKEKLRDYIGSDQIKSIYQTAVDKGVANILGLISPYKCKTNLFIWHTTISVKMGMQLDWKRTYKASRRCWNTSGWFPVASTAVRKRNPADCRAFRGCKKNSNNQPDWPKMTRHLRHMISSARKSCSDPIVVRFSQRILWYFVHPRTAMLRLGVAVVTCWCGNSCRSGHRAVDSY